MLGCLWAAGEVFSFLDFRCVCFCVVVLWVVFGFVLVLFKYLVVLSFWGIFVDWVYLFGLVIFFDLVFSGCFWRCSVRCRCCFVERLLVWTCWRFVLVCGSFFLVGSA